MKTIKRMTTLFLVVLTFNFVSGQEQKPSGNEPQNEVTKANYNTVRSNKKSIAAPDKKPGGDVSTDTDNSNSGTTANIWSKISD